MSEPQWLGPWRARVAVVVHVVIYCWAWTHHERLQRNYVQTISPCPLSFHDNYPQQLVTPLCPLVHLDEESKWPGDSLNRLYSLKHVTFIVLKTVSPGECRSMGRGKNRFPYMLPWVKVSGSLLLHFLKPRILPLWIYTVLPVRELCHIRSKYVPYWETTYQPRVLSSLSWFFTAHLQDHSNFPWVSHLLMKLKEA